MGVTRQTIIALEAGKYVPSLLLAFRLARVFGVSIEGVFQYQDGFRRDAVSRERTSGNEDFAAALGRSGPP